MIAVTRFWNDSVLWLSNHYLQIVIACTIGTIIVAVLIGVRALGQRLCRDERPQADWRSILGRTIGRTGLFFMIMLATRLVTGYAAPPPMVERTIYVLFTIASALQVAIWARELVLGFVEHRMGPDAEHSSLGSAMGIIRLLVSFALFAIAIVVILDNLGVNVTGLVAGLGIGGIAIGLAAKGIFDDLFSALSIIFDKPFRRGDSIRYDSTSGSVEAIGLKTTRIRAVTGEEVVISNTNLLNKELHNLARLDRRRVILVLGVTYSTPPEVCADIPAIVKEIVEGIDKCKYVRCGMINFAASSLDFEVQVDVMSEVWDVVFNARHKVCVALLGAFNDRGIEFAFPTQTSMTAAPDGRYVMPYPDYAMLATHPVETDGDEPAVSSPPARRN